MGLPEGPVREARALARRKTCAAADAGHSAAGPTQRFHHEVQVARHIDDVIAFQAQDKYTRVLTATDDAIIRTSLRELLRGLDPEVFWHVHRSLIVRATAIDKLKRDELGQWIKLKGQSEWFAVSQAFHSRLRHQPGAVR